METDAGLASLAYDIDELASYPFYRNGLISARLRRSYKNIGSYEMGPSPHLPHELPLVGQRV